GVAAQDLPGWTLADAAAAVAFTGREKGRADHAAGAAVLRVRVRRDALTVAEQGRGFARARAGRARLVGATLLAAAPAGVLVRERIAAHAVALELAGRTCAHS